MTRLNWYFLLVSAKLRSREFIPRVTLAEAHDYPNGRSCVTPKRTRLDVHLDPAPSPQLEKL